MLLSLFLQSCLQFHSQLSMIVMVLLLVQDAEVRNLLNRENRDDQA